MTQQATLPAAPDPAPVLKGIIVPTRQALFWQRVGMLLITVIPLAGLGFAMWRWWGDGISTVDVGLLVGFYVFAGLGITVGFHRLFTHQSYKAPAPVRLVVAIAGSMAIEGPVIDWVAAHRRHHAYSDRPGDPHSPHLDDESFRGMMRGLWHAHLGWLFARDATAQETWAPDLLRDPVVRWVSRTFLWWTALSIVSPAVIGGLLTGTWRGALTGLLWGGLVRIFLLHHVTWSINSICHFFGTRPFESHDEARNNPVMALLGFGEGWHNGHHAFPASARHGLRWWELDVSYLVIRLLALLGLARDVKVPSPNQLARRTRGRALPAASDPS